MKKNRIWELDALRGLCILGMVVFHLLYDLTELYRLVSWRLPAFLFLVQYAGGRVFLILSGLCVTLGSRCVRRGLNVLAGGMLCTAVTAGMHRLGLAGASLIIRFGVLHCLGCCMLLWPAFKKLPWQALCALGVVMVCVGAYLDWSNLRTDVVWLFPLGIPYYGFSSGDYYPLLPCLGYFLLGSVLGRTLYRRQQTLLPRVDPAFLPVAFLRICGQQSLLIYLLHQPILTGVLSLVTQLMKE